VIVLHAVGLSEQLKALFVKVFGTDILLKRYLLPYLIRATVGNMTRKLVNESERTV
jgi:hypothetical protein